MILENFNQLPTPEKEHIYNELCEKFNKENLEYFFIKSTTERFFSKKTNIFLSKNYSHRKWDIFLNIFNWECFNEEKKEKIIKIKSDLSKISKILLKFNQLDEMFRIDVGVAGGALRDVLLMENPRIKDVDIILSFKYTKEFLTSYFNSNPNRADRDRQVFFDKIKTTNKKLNNLNMRALDIRHIESLSSLDEMIKYYIFNLIDIVFSSNFNTISKYEVELKNTRTLKNIIPSIDYVDKHLKGLVKIKDDSFNYEIDILLTSISVDNYMEAFDYSICKMLFVFVRDNVQIIDSLSPSEFINSILLSEEIYKDLSINQLTFNIDNFSANEIEKSILNHYPRIKEKYPQLRLIINSPRNIHPKSFIESINLMLDLQKNLAVKNLDKKEIIKI